MNTQNNPTIFPVLVWPNELLERRCEDIDPLKLEDTHGMTIEQLLYDMIHTAISQDGVGLAAPQIGLNVNVIVMIINNKVISLINPKIINFGEETEIVEEGCLSLPGYFKKVERSRTIILKYIDIEGTLHEVEFGGWWSRIAQHEIDHLHGKTLASSANNHEKEKILTIIEKYI